MRSRSCARIGVQFSELTSASKPAANKAHMVVNMASLPSTLTLVTGASRNPRRARGLVGGAGACAGGGTCAGARVGPVTGDGSIAAAHKIPNAIHANALIIKCAATSARARGCEIGAPYLVVTNRL